VAFPWLHYSTFDDGTLQNFNSETDASGILDFPHYGVLANGGFAPWQGAHCVRLALSGTAVAFLEEVEDFDTALAGRIFVWFSVCIGANLTLTAGDTVILLALQSAGAVNEVVVGVRNNGGVYELFAGEAGATRTLPITRSNSRWYQIELDCLIDDGASNNGTIDFYVDGAAVGAQITALDQAAIAQARFGAVSGTAAGNAGTILLGGIIADDLRVYPRERFPKDTRWVTRDQTVFVGPCTIDAASVTGTGTDAVMTLLDTDVYEATGIAFSREPREYIRNVTANDTSPGFTTPKEFKKGVYVQLTGTNPQGFVSIRSPSQVVQSQGGYVDRGQRRKGLI